jgi:sugar-specific transcriptional regulator TrmB
VLKIGDRLAGALAELGLSRYEVLVYPHLLKKEAATVAELYAALKVPKSRIYEALDALERRGFIYRQDIKPIRYMAVEPEVALREHARSMVESIRRNEEVARSALQSFAERSEGSPQTPEFWFVHRRSQKYALIDRMMAATSAEARLTVNDAGLAKLLLYESRTGVHQRLRKEGKSIRVLCFGAQPLRVERAMRFAEVRLMDRALPRLVIVDRSELVMLLHTTRDTLTIDKGEDIALVSRNADFVGLFCGIFDSYWEEWGRPPAGP